MNILKMSFFFAPWYQGTECVPIIIGPTIELNLGTMQKHQNLVSNMLPSTSGTAHTSMNSPFLDFLAFWGVFYVFDEFISRYLRHLSYT